MATADDQARLLVSIEANQRSFAKQMQAVAKQSADAAKYVEGNFKKANDNVANSFQRGSRQATASMRQSSAAVSNLSFQLNDIAMGLASGTSPFTIMVQQGSQVSQALGAAGGGLTGAVKALGGAFASMVSPVSLASFALIGLTGYAVQYFTTVQEDTANTDKLLQEHANLIKSFDEAYGIAAEGARKYTEAARQISLLKLQDEFGSLQAAARAAADAIKNDILSIPADEFGGATKIIADFDAALRLLEQDQPDFSQFSIQMAEIANSTGAPANIRELATQFRLAAQESIGLEDAISGASERLNTVYLSAEDAKVAFEALTSAVIGFGSTGAEVISGVAGAIQTHLIPAAANAVRALGTLVKNYNSLQSQIGQTPLGQLSPIYSGGGQFLNEAEWLDMRADETQSHYQLNLPKTGGGGRGGADRAAAEEKKRLAAAAREAAAAQKELNQQTKEFQSFGQSLVGGFINDLRKGASAADAMRGALDKVLDKVIEISLQNIFSGFGGLGGMGGGLLGGMLIPGILHKGGVAGSDGYGHGRAVSPSVFAGAKRYHSGGVAGLQPGEVPAILQRGEVVLPRGTKAGGGSRDEVTIHLQDDSGRMAAIADQRIQTQSGTIVNVAVGRATKAAPAAVGRHQVMKAGGDYRNS
ncbi:phage tail length tape measure family protein [Rhizobium sp. ARZ01]|uniref:phage tail length tape measure family protein n=1 Tax=Rhizobium sp. ARZ01 TaxID=2769313 RepID=UPI0017835A18|nr:phage tail length tape measure family protein [Rhizobium sp. ARZ01]MBD9372115.1 phage tail length tape measure family protein [Rhizobium sp. ARZ01]